MFTLLEQTQGRPQDVFRGGVKSSQPTEQRVCTDYMQSFIFILCFILKITNFTMTYNYTSSEISLNLVKYIRTKHLTSTLDLH